MKFFISSVAFLIFVSCNSDNCDQLLQGETLEISDPTKMFVKNYLNSENIVFENQQNEEVKFKVSELSESFSNFRFTIQCEEDLDKFQTIQTTSEFIELNLVNQANISSDSIYISLIQIPNEADNSEEEVIVTSGKLNSNNSNQASVLLSYNNSETHVNFLDSLNINGKTFYSVYEPDNIDWVPKYDVKYTLNEGIVFLKDNSTNLELTYLRAE